eukprot:g11746.t1
MRAYFDALLIRTTPFPKPFTQIINIGLFLTLFLIPLTMHVAMKGSDNQIGLDHHNGPQLGKNTLLASVILSNCSCFGFFALAQVASELEDPFGEDFFDHPLEHWQSDFDLALLDLLAKVDYAVPECRKGVANAASGGANTKNGGSGRSNKKDGLYCGARDAADFPPTKSGSLQPARCCSKPARDTMRHLRSNARKDSNPDAAANLESYVHPDVGATRSETLAAMFGSRLQSAVELKRRSSIEGTIVHHPSGGILAGLLGDRGIPDEDDSGDPNRSSSTGPSGTRGIPDEDDSGDPNRSSSTGPSGVGPAAVAVEPHYSIQTQPSVGGQQRPQSFVQQQSLVSTQMSQTATSQRGAGGSSSSSSRPQSPRGGGSYHQQNSSYRMASSGASTCASRVHKDLRDAHAAAGGGIPLPGSLPSTPSKRRGASAVDDQDFSPVGGGCSGGAGNGEKSLFDGGTNRILPPALFGAGVGNAAHQASAWSRQANHVHFDFDGGGGGGQQTGTSAASGGAARSDHNRTMNTNATLVRSPHPAARGGDNSESFDERAPYLSPKPKVYPTLLTTTENLPPAEGRCGGTR